MFTFRCRELNACPTVRSENVCVIHGLWKIGEEGGGGGGNIHIFVVLLLVVLCLHYACICEHKYMNTAPPHSLNGSFEQLTESNYA